ncbi:alpha-tocopherol transfer protein-like [Neocloeon triangulifer]|uniref:alpha-tocopherol transfer protein-like n=1 Tax=Neocloeon triangulifer TaxID=2078957 RepID=UPI00286F4E52|nr:alpha-tocopherol transfer protein-like [Neocloeon triangulifer]
MAKELKIRELSPKLLEVAKKELNEDPKRRSADVQAIRDWLKKQPHILAAPDDQTLVSFLRGCKFSLERTKEKIDMYYTMRTIVPEFFGVRNLKEQAIKEILENGSFFPLPEPDDEGCRVMLVRPARNDPDRHPMELVFKVVMMAMDYMIREDDQMLICGIVSIIDLENVTLNHGVQMTPALIKKVMTCSQEGFPLREKGLNYVHTPPMFETIFGLFKTFAKEKLKKRMHAHGENMESLYKNVPQRLLPSEYGGTAGSTKELNEAWLKRLRTYDPWFMEETGGVDESKRPGKPKTHQELFGLEGSFRQLTVD